MGWGCGAGIARWQLGPIIVATAALRAEMIRVKPLVPAAKHRSTVRLPGRWNNARKGDSPGVNNCTHAIAINRARVFQQRNMTPLGRIHNDEKTAPLRETAGNRDHAP